ncbi:pyridoxamine 5'-phosphate oxidase family protein [Lichenihabitans sp. Uapishka_5]|uniref:HugZ family pyridoxamine 5'-phosphate oxidase n=1 Tax=Lichenihabitans sp. Uapishka_5 TaxID=3037302 RepID=UPI0029E7E3A6|nr:DUF2470 domain-containing protein [Lichenihabitans sp. Uapishka_5]MDX7950104.1 pyridoxamine 5'-phosphate oxidase family protein [Lichenihabitans sp. Uapishka_5]
MTTTVPAAPDPGLLTVAKRLLRVVRAATLATLTSDGMPFASLATVATLPDGSPILLLSRLAHHTRHLEADRRCSLLLADRGRGDPLAHARLTLLGRAEPLVDAAATAARRRFLARNPKAELYADFPDFGFWRFAITAAHLNGGFGQAASVSADALLTNVEGCDALLDGEEGAVAHMNADHSDAIALYAARLLGLPERVWRLSGLDPDGLDFVAGDLTGRLAFETRVTSGAKLRPLLMRLAAEARARAP